MDLVICPSCHFTFSPTPGQAVKCPACMTAITLAAAKGTSPRKSQPAPSRRPARKPRPAKKSSAPLLVVGLLFAVAVVGGGFLIVKTALSNRTVPDAAAGLPPEKHPDVIVPKNDEGPPAPEATAPAEATAKPNAPKIRPIDPGDVPPAPVDVPADAPKVAQIKIRAVPGVTVTSLDAAIKKGSEYLYGSTGKWFAHESHPLGYLALGGLTLLECQTPKTDPVIRQAADRVRKLAANSDMTYEITLAILFLDRLGETRDRDLLRTLGARLVAGQDAGGGFTYWCPVLSAHETTQLLTTLNANRPRTAPAPLSIDGDKSIRREAPKPGDDELDPFAPTDPDKKADKAAVESRPAPPTGDGNLVSQPPKILPKSRLGPNTGTVRLENAAKDPSGLPARLLQVPAVVNRGRDKDQLILAYPETRQTDHSNLQFAVLGMWVARRHGVVSDRALLLSEARMRKMQMPEGGWMYAANTPTHQEAMVCAGMLSLALGHAVHQSHPAGLANAFAADANIARATKRLGETVSDPIPDFSGKVPEASTYLLWSIERVAVLFNLSSIDGKDWYGWGSQILLKHQQPDGSWNLGGYPSATQHTDTCFALLFLVRSNLVQEVSEQIRLQTPIAK
jgi:hypothetical protein